MVWVEGHDVERVESCKEHGWKEGELGGSVNKHACSPLDRVEAYSDS
jgi:hypothetical protein